MAAKKPRKKSSPRVSGGKPVVIVESPAKAKTINLILGSGYIVKACMGHVRDLPERAFGVEIDNDFHPTYETIKGKRRILSELRALTKGAETVYLAPDPDREGEAIAWHLLEALRIPKSRARRVTFNEITKRGVEEGFQRPGEISMPRVHAQQARRVLDRIVGYTLSPLLWKNVGKGTSAGRVQSVAVRLIVDREREIQAFKPEEYWAIVATLDKAGAEFKATLTKLDGREIGLASESTVKRPFVQVSTAEQSTSLVEELKTAVYEVVDIQRNERQEPPPPPFTTSLLQQAASTRLHFPAKKTMKVAQELYEGIELGSEGAVGLITYMRTDSFRVAPEALDAVRRLIAKDYGPAYVPEKPVYRAARKGAQEAHEAIRPTYVGLRPEEIKASLTKDQYELYRLIWRQFVASQMRPAKVLFSEAEIKAGRALFTAKGREVQFDGYTKLLGHALRPDEQVLPPLGKGDRPALKDLAGKQRFTEPPPRYTEASLVKALERHGIGRPSTYAPILSVIQERDYVRLDERKFFPTELGTRVIDKLVKHFSEILDLGFTAKMEKDLDDIEDGERTWTDVLRAFNDPFTKQLARARVEMESEKGSQATSDVQVEICDLCEAPMGVKSGKRGRFLACTKYPDCRGARSLPRRIKGLEIPQGWREDCDKCGKPLRIRYGRRGGFIACAAYPVCKNTRRFPKVWYK
jgi:DNA topoisomerase-1